MPKPARGSNICGQQGGEPVCLHPAKIKKRQLITRVGGVSILGTVIMM